MVITSSGTFPQKLESVLNPNSLGLTCEGRLTTSWELQNSTVEGLVSFVCKTMHLPGFPPSPWSVSVKDWSSQWWPPVLLTCGPRYQGSAALRCWQLKCGELSRWRHYPIAIVIPLVDNFYFSTTAFIAQLFYLKCWTFILLRISELAIGNSVMVLCIIKSLCHRNWWPSVVHSVYILLLGWPVAPFLSPAQNAEQWGPSSVREKESCLFTYPWCFLLNINNNNKENLGTYFFIVKYLLKFVSLRLLYFPFHFRVHIKRSKRMAEGLHLIFSHFQDFGFFVFHFSFPGKQIFTVVCGQK